MSSITVDLADPTLPEARALIAALDTYLGGLYQPEENHLLDPEQLKAPAMRFLLAWRDDRAVGCGALRLDPAAGYAEIKRMYVDPAHRGQGIASAILARLEDLTRTAGIDLLKLETGTLQQEAVSLYRRLGFTPCGAFGDYPCGGDASLFMEKRI